MGDESQGEQATTAQPVGSEFRRLNEVIDEQARGEALKKDFNDKAQKFLLNVIEEKEFLPLRKYNRKVAHRKGESKSGVKSGRFPVNLSRVFIKLLQSAKANADFKGLDSENLLISHCFASRGFGRRSVQPKGHIAGKRRRSKSTHVEVIVKEAK